MIVTVSSQGPGRALGQTVGDLGSAGLGGGSAMRAEEDDVTESPRSWGQARAGETQLLPAWGGRLGGERPG